MPFPNEHAARLVAPGKFVRFARKNDDLASGVDSIFGIRKDGKSELQALRFDKKKFSTAQAKSWLSDHDFTPTLFEKAERVTEAEHTVSGGLPLGSDGKCPVGSPIRRQSGGSMRCFKRTSEADHGAPVTFDELEKGTIGLMLGTYLAELHQELHGAESVGMFDTAFELSLVMDSMQNVIKTLNIQMIIQMGRYEKIGLLIGTERFKRIMDDHITPLEMSSLKDSPSQARFKDIRAALDTIQNKVFEADRAVPETFPPDIFAPSRATEGIGPVDVAKFVVDLPDSATSRKRAIESMWDDLHMADICDGTVEFNYPGESKFWQILDNRSFASEYVYPT